MNNNRSFPEQPLYMIQLYVVIRIIGYVCFCFYLFSWMSVFASSELPVATTAIVEGNAVSVGSVVYYSEVTDRYRTIRADISDIIYGVVGGRPAIVFVTNENAVPVVTNGTTLVQVRADTGAIQRGDILAVAEDGGVAVRADDIHTDVFAIALESYSGSDIGVILADIGAEKARDLYNARQLEIANEREGVATSTTSVVVSTARAIIAIVILIGALVFVLYSFKHILTTSVVSIGRNPRARLSVTALAIGSMLFVMAIGVLVLLVAIGVLVLPV